eukprot:6467712-Amphidinium_carterae.1
MGSSIVSICSIDCIKNNNDDQVRACNECARKHGGRNTKSRTCNTHTHMSFCGSPPEVLKTLQGAPFKHHPTSPGLRHIMHKAHRSHEVAINDGEEHVQEEAIEYEDVWDEPDPTQEWILCYWHYAIHALTCNVRVRVLMQPLSCVMHMKARSASTTLCIQCNPLCSSPRSRTHLKYGEASVGAAATHSRATEQLPSAQDLCAHPLKPWQCRLRPLCVIAREHVAWDKDPYQ